MNHKPFVLIFTIALWANLSPMGYSQGSDCDSFLVRNLHPITALLADAPFDDLQALKSVVGTSTVSYTHLTLPTKRRV